MSLHTLDLNNGSDLCKVNLVATVSYNKKNSALLFSSFTAFISIYGANCP